MRWGRLTLVVFATVATAAVFQNCSGFKAVSSDSSNSSSSELGAGVGPCNPALAKTVENPTDQSLQPQLVTLPGATTCVAKTEGTSYQFLSNGDLVFQTDLKAGEKKSISIQGVLNNAFPVRQPLMTTETDDAFTLANEYYTVVINKRMDLAQPKAPVRAISSKLGNVRLSGSVGPQQWVETFSPQWPPVAPTLLDYRFEILERGPLLVRVKATYSFRHTDYNYGNTVVFPASDNAFASEVIELRAGVNAVFFEEETKHNWIHGFTIENLNVNQVRYRGHSANTIGDGYTTTSTGARQAYRVCCDNEATPYQTAIKDVSRQLLRRCSIAHRRRQESPHSEGSTKA